MRGWDAARVAGASGGELLSAPAGADAVGPSGAAVDTRALERGQLFVGLSGARTDGGGLWREALAAGAWGALLAPAHAREAAAEGAGAVIAHPQPLAGLQALARAWREALRARGAQVVAITGSTGKTSTKDILAALLGSRARTAATQANLNTEIGLPLSILAADADAQVLVLELAMRGAGQIAELTAIADPDVGVIVNVGPAHLELLGSLEAIAAAKAELIAGLRPGASAVVPAGEPLLAAHLRGDVRTITFGDDGDVTLQQLDPEGWVTIRAGRELVRLQPSFGQAHNLRNLLAAVAAARALGHTPTGRVDVRFSSSRGQRLELGEDVVVIDDCYNANPMSMRAAIEDLSAAAPARRVAVLGDMLELGPQGPELHREIGRLAGEHGVQLLVTVGPLAAEMRAGFSGETHCVPDAAAAAALVPSLVRPRDTVLVKGSRGVGLERVVDALAGDGDRTVPPRLARERAPLAPGAARGRP